MTNEAADMRSMSEYEAKRWDELVAYWERPPMAERMVPEQLRPAIEKASAAAGAGMSTARDWAAQRIPAPAKKAADGLTTAALGPALQGALGILDLLTRFASELTDPEAPVIYHQKKGRPVQSIGDLRRLDLKELDEFTRGSALKSRGIGLLEGAGMGTLAMIPVPAVGSMAAVTGDILAVQALSAALSTRICYAYGIDPSQPEVQRIVSHIVNRSLTSADTAAKTGGVKHAGDAFAAAAGRVKWSPKIKADHQILAAMEKLLKAAGGKKPVSITAARMSLPVVSIVIGAGFSQQILGNVLKETRRFAATKHLADKYGLPLPTRLEQHLRDDTSDLL